MEVFKMKKRYRAVAMSALMASVLMSQSYAGTAMAQTTDILVIGDGISSGEGLNSTETAYPEIVAQALGQNVVYETNASYTSEDVLNLVSSDKVKTEISKSDVILVTVSSNDIMNPILEVVDTDKYKTLDKAASSINIMSSEVVGVYSKLQKEKYTVSDNIESIYDEIKSANSSAKIVFQTVYNPLSVSYDLAGMGTVGQTIEKDILSLINETITGLSGAYVADTYTTFAKKADFYTDIDNLNVYPTQAGQMAIAADIMNILEVSDKKLSTMTSSYSELTAEQKKVLRQNYATEFTDIKKYLDFTIGDVNSDGKIDSIDAVQILKDYASSIVSGKGTALDLNSADLNFDGSVNSIDAVKVLVYYANSLVGKASDIDTYIASGK
jgi:lysophospholipase L1-like esterase